MAVTAPELLDRRASEPSLAEVSGIRTAVETPEYRSVPFRDLYAEHFDSVWRSLRSLGVPDHALDDAVQEVFIVVHRRLHDFDARSSLRTWLFGIVLRVARNARRTERRKGGLIPLTPELDLIDPAPGPHEDAATLQALRRVAIALDELSDTRREIFVMAELEEMSAPEIALALKINVNTVYSRLRSARITFEAAMSKLQEDPVRV